MGGGGGGWGRNLGWQVPLHQILNRGHHFLSPNTSLSISMALRALSLAERTSPTGRGKPSPLPSPPKPLPPRSSLRKENWNLGTKFAYSRTTLHTSPSLLVSFFLQEGSPGGDIRLITAISANQASCYSSLSAPLPDHHPPTSRTTSHAPGSYRLQQSHTG